MTEILITLGALLAIFLGLFAVAVIGRLNEDVLDHRHVHRPRVD